MSDEQQRLEKLLLDYVEKVSVRATSEEETKSIPAVALALIELWNVTSLF